MSRKRTPRPFSGIKKYMASPLTFAEHGIGIRLRSYQQPVAQAIVNSVIQGLGHSIVVIFPRQSGKNELQALVEAYLLSLYHDRPAEIVKISPTARPQSQTAMRRLERILQRSKVDVGRWQKESGYIYRVGQARIYFLSGASDSNIVGATASTLLEVDEAQDVEIDKYDREIAPMAAATNATRVFWGTAWTSRTLLARELRLARTAELADGLIRSFVSSSYEVSAEVPAYGKFVNEQIARLGRTNPLVKTQFFCEEIDAEAGMFNPARRALMQGTHPPQTSPQRANLPPFQGSNPGLYAITIDVAGEDESARDEPGASLVNPGRDSTALTVFDILIPAPLTPNPSPLADSFTTNLPTYHVVARHQWTGIKHSSLFSRLTALIDLWQPTWLIIDATGVGQTLASFLLDRYPAITLPFVFTSASKSALGWNFITLIETGRYKEYQPDNSPPFQGGAGGRSDAGSLQRDFWTQVENCQYDILDGPGRLMRWGVPDGTRDPRSGDLVHDDLLISAALVSELDDKPFGLAVSKVLKAPDLFEKMDF